MDGLRLAKVIRFVPEAYAADLLFLDDGSRVPMVPVTTPYGSTNTGVADMAEPDPGPSGEQWDPLDSNTRDTVAVVGFYRGVPLVIGFLFPQVCQMLFAEKNRRVQRHPSDVYTTIDDDGNVELYHPSGTYFRIGETPTHEDLTGKDFDKKWKIARNTDKAVHVHLSVKNAGTEVASLDLDPSGNLVGDVANDATLTAGNQIRAEVPNSSLTINPTALTLASNGSTIVLDASGVAVNGVRIDFN